MRCIKTKYIYLFFITISFIFLSLVTAKAQADEGTILWHEFNNIVKALPDDTILLDVRTPEETAQGKFQNSINIPLSELEKRHVELPKELYDIIIYCANGMRAEQAYRTLKAFGYTRVQFLRAEVIFAPAGTFTIAPLFEGEITVTEFTRILESKPKDKIILDVRTPEEAAEGRFKDSILIPIKEFKERYSELPKDKEIIIYCAFGGRAEKAYQMLTYLDYTKVKYLSAKVTFLPDGSYTITKN